MIDRAADDDRVVMNRNQRDVGRGNRPLQNAAEVIHVQLDDDFECLSASVQTGQRQPAGARVLAQKQNGFGRILDRAHLEHSFVEIFRLGDGLRRLHLQGARAADRNDDRAGARSGVARRRRRGLDSLLRHGAASGH